MKFKTGIKRRRFAGTGRPGDQQNSVRQTDQPLERLLVVREKSQLGQAELQALPCREYA